LDCSEVRTTSGDAGLAPATFPVGVGWGAAEEPANAGGGRISHWTRKKVRNFSQRAADNPYRSSPHHRGERQLEGVMGDRRYNKPGTFYFIARRTENRTWWIDARCQRTRSIFLYVLAVVAERYDMDVYAYTCMSNHVHIVLFD